VTAVTLVAFEEAYNPAQEKEQEAATARIVDRAVKERRNDGEVSK